MIGFVLGVLLSGVARADSGDTNPALKGTRVELDLVDGSRVIGLPRVGLVPFQTSYAKMNIAWEEIRSITMAADHENATILFRNRDKLTGIIAFGTVSLDALFGSVKVGVEQVKRINVLRDVAELKAGEVLVVDVAGMELELVWIPPGEFAMGSPASEAGRHPGETPQHRVKLTKGFWMGKYEVTQELWEKVMGKNPSKFKGARHPVEQVSWNDCQEFIGKLNGMVPDGGFRLPTEAEWEYACRAGTTGRFYSGSADSDLDGVAWYRNNRDGDTTRPVGQKRANAWGLYDMHGSVEEWCQDLYGEYPSDAVTDPGGPSAGPQRVLRGGSWLYSPEVCRSASRGSNPATAKFDVIGFRVIVAGR